MLHIPQCFVTYFTQRLHAQIVHCPEHALTHTQNCWNPVKWRKRHPSGAQAQMFQTEVFIEILLPKAKITSSVEPVNHGLTPVSEDMSSSRARTAWRSHYRYVSSLLSFFTRSPLQRDLDSRAAAPPYILLSPRPWLLSLWRIKTAPWRRSSCQSW